MVEIGFRLIERALFDLHIGFGLMEGCHRLIDVGLRGRFPGEQLLRARCRNFGKFKRSLRAGHIALCLSDCGLKYCWIDLRYDLSRFHLRIKICE